MREQAERRIGHLYPQFDHRRDGAEGASGQFETETPPTPAGGRDSSPSSPGWGAHGEKPRPAFSHVDVPLASTFVLSNKAAKDAWCSPVLGDSYRFEVKRGTPPEECQKRNQAGIARGEFSLILSPNDADWLAYIKAEGMAGRMDAG